MILSLLPRPIKPVKGILRPNPIHTVVLCLGVRSEAEASGNYAVVKGRDVIGRSTQLVLND
jgi:hypothetical protein